MGRIRRDISTLTPIQAEAFRKLALTVTGDLGVTAGLKALGISTPTYYQLIRNQTITDKQAAALMAGYKSTKLAAPPWSQPKQEQTCKQP